MLISVRLPLLLQPAVLLPPPSAGKEKIICFPINSNTERNAINHRADSSVMMEIYDEWKPVIRCEFINHSMKK